MSPPWSDILFLCFLWLWQDEIRAKRNQEAEERRWRQKEKELAIKKAREEAKLRAARLEQVQNKEHCLSIEAGREKAAFERVLE